MNFLSNKVHSLNRPVQYTAGSSALGFNEKIDLKNWDGKSCPRGNGDDNECEFLHYSYLIFPHRIIRARRIIPNFFIDPSYIYGICRNGANIN